MHESGLLAHIFGRSRDLAAAFPHVLVGPGDDCAVVAAPGGAALLLKVDQLIEHRHFAPGTALDMVARKALARGLSDIAAMAGTPLAGLAAAALPAGFPQGRANELFDAANHWSRVFGCPLVGGDIAAFAEPSAPITLSITIIGLPHARRGPVLRSGAKVGDAVYVTGAIGGSLDVATGGGRHLTFEPRLREAAWLADSQGHDLHALMDISDGLGLDAGRLAQASAVAIDIDARAVPLAPGAGPVEKALADGEDYELLFTVDHSAHVPKLCPMTGTAVTRIGTVTAGSGCVMVMQDGARRDITGMGFEHR